MYDCCINSDKVAWRRNVGLQRGEFFFVVPVSRYCVGRGEEGVKLPLLPIMAKIVSVKSSL